MKKILMILLLISSFVSSKLLIGENMRELSFKNQLDQTVPISADTQKIIFVFTEENGEKVHTFLEKQTKGYLWSKHILFVQNISDTSFLKRWFLVEKFTKMHYDTLLLTDQNDFEKYYDHKNKDKIMVLSLDNFKIVGIDYIHEIHDLYNLIERN